MIKNKILKILKKQKNEILELIEELRILKKYLKNPINSKMCETLIKENNISLKNIENKISEFEERGLTTMIIAEDKKILGIIGVADSIKEDSALAIEKLNKYKYKIIQGAS